MDGVKRRVTGHRLHQVAERTCGKDLVRVGCTKKARAMSLVCLNVTESQVGGRKGNLWWGPPYRDAKAARKEEVLKTPRNSC